MERPAEYSRCTGKMGFYKMAAATTFACLLAGAVPLFAVAGPHGHPPGPPPGHPPGRSHAHGPRAAAGQNVISGTLLRVDYGTGTIQVATPAGRTVVEVTPSTSIFTGGSDGSMADLHAGRHVDVSTSTIGGRLVAQIIRIR